MVFFTCTHCGESLKKSKVEKHYQTVCSRNSVAVTCIDCCKDFSAQTYPAHTKCVSEEEKYSAKGFVPHPSANKGEQKQKKWQDIMQSLQENDSRLSRDERTILNAIVNQENVPRKKLRFQNFLRNAMKNQYNAQAAETLFDKIEAFSKEEELRNKQDNQNKAEISKEEEEENTDADAGDVKENDDNPSQEQVEEKLSKKERKEKRKRAKYEAELKEIEGNKTIEAEGKDEDEDEDEGGKKENPITENKTQEGREKSRKKHKRDVAVVENGVSQDTEAGSSKKKHNKETVMLENGISEESELAEGKKLKKKNKKEISVTENGDTKMSEDGKSKKKRKKCQEEIEDICGEGPTKKKLKKNDTKGVDDEESIHAASEKTKFNLQETIIKALESKDSKELLVKRLRKKVLAEYEATGAGSATDVKMIAKFNKKILKIPGVVVHKEVVKLC